MGEVISIRDATSPRHSSPVLSKDAEAIEVIPVAPDPEPRPKWFGGVNEVHLCPPYGTDAAALGTGCHHCGNICDVRGRWYGSYEFLRWYFGEAAVWSFFFIIVTTI